MLHCPYSSEEFKIIRGVYGFLSEFKYPYTVRLHPLEGSLDSAIFNALGRFEYGRDSREDEVYSALQFMPNKRLLYLDAITTFLTVKRCFRREEWGIYTISIPKKEMIVQCWKSPEYVRPIAHRVAQELGWIKRPEPQQLIIPF